MADRPPIAVVHPYWTLWEHTAGPTFRADRLELSRRAAGAFEDAFEIAGIDDIASVEEGRALGARLAAQHPRALLAIVSMAVPPAYLLAALDALPDVPVVVWALHETGLAGGDLDHGGVTTQGATVGAPMVTNMLSRRQRPFEMVLGRMDDDATRSRVQEALRLATVASGIGRARLGRIGSPVEGYLHVDLDDVELREATGIEVVHVDPEEVVTAYREVTAARVGALESEVRAGWRFEEDVEREESLARSLQAALALEDVVARHRLDGGAFNCHVPQFRFGDEIGIAPCWGLGRLTSMGIPLTCTGDIVTAVAMLTTKRLGAAALYHELEAIDYATGELVIANSGEHDLAWRDLPAGENALSVVRRHGHIDLPPPAPPGRKTVCRGVHGWKAIYFRPRSFARGHSHFLRLKYSSMAPATTAMKASTAGYAHGQLSSGMLQGPMWGLKFMP